MENTVDIHTVVKSNFKKKWNISKKCSVTFQKNVA